jgi:hypothetical protein
MAERPPIAGETEDKDRPRRCCGVVTVFARFINFLIDPDATLQNPPLELLAVIKAADEEIAELRSRVFALENKGITE